MPAKRLSPAAIAGGVNIVYGSAKGLSSVGDQLLTHQMTDVTFAANNLFGASLTHGDFNSDGFAGLAMGASSTRKLSRLGHGLLRVIWRPDGPRQTGLHG